MVNTRAEAFAPATVANLGVGFDILGLALCEPGDVVQVEVRDEPGAVILSIEGDGGRLPREADRNTACVSANSVLRQVNAPHGVGIHLFKNLPLASGMGSSAASAVASAAAVNKLLGEPLAPHDLLRASLDGEAAVSGYHADNVAPCLFGGITLVTGVESDQIRRLPLPDNLYLALVTPDVAVPTALARSVLPQMIPLKSMVSQTAAIASLVDALYRGDIEAMAAAMEKDAVIEPSRAHLMPLLSAMRQTAKSNGAFGLFISGAGPTLCAVCGDIGTAQEAAQAMQTVYHENGIQSSFLTTGVSPCGVRSRILDA